MIAMLPYLLFILALLWTLDNAARADYDEIERRKRVNDKRNLDHGKLWRNRAALISIYLVVTCIALYLMCRWTWWHVPSLALIGYGVMACGHRWTLNSLRGLKWYYMGVLGDHGNKYDMFWWYLRLMPGLFMEPDKRDKWVDEHAFTGRTARQMARMAYGTELISATLGALAPWVIQYLK